MSRRKLFVFLLAAVFMIGAVGSVNAATGSALITQYGCLGCHNPIPTSATNAAMVTRLTGAINGGTMNGISSLKALTAADIQAISDYLVPPVAPLACTGYTYSAWSACSANGQQTRTVAGNTPAGCSGTPSTAAVLTQACTPTSQACTGYTYSAWSACGTNGLQTRTVTGNTPAGCSGTPSTATVLTQSCTTTSTACTYTYSAWSACKHNNRQTRKVLSKSPAKCTGTPWVTQVCNYVPPSPPPATDGTTLYMQRCSACHGSIQKSQVRGESASDIKEAISEVGKMSFLNFLTNAQIQAIANALVTSAPPPTPPVPYGGVHPAGWLKLHPDFAEKNGTSACKSCHGQDLQGGTGPSCYSCHKNNDD